MGLKDVIIKLFQVRDRHLALSACLGQVKLEVGQVIPET